MKEKKEPDFDLRIYNEEAFEKIVSSQKELALEYQQ